MRRRKIDISEKKVDFENLPQGLPIPKNDGACCHLEGVPLPSIKLMATSGDEIDLSREKIWLVIYCYVKTGHPDQEPVGGAAKWNAIPGARGCTPQACSYRDHYAELVSLGVKVYGLSTQETSYQKEAVQRLHLPLPLLSDSNLEFAKALRLPTFMIEGIRLIRRLTLIAHQGLIKKVFYPVFPPNRDAEQVIQWLHSSSAFVGEAAKKSL